MILMNEMAYARKAQAISQKVAFSAAWPTETVLAGCRASMRLFPGVRIKGEIVRRASEGLQPLPAMGAILPITFQLLTAVRAGVDGCGFEGRAQLVGKERSHHEHDQQQGDDPHEGHDGFLS
jgi:hypothetical protein